jgi:hypothetical protein
MTLASPSYTVPPPLNGRHICFERTLRVWVAFIDGVRVASGPTAEAARDTAWSLEAQRFVEMLKRAVGR